MGREPPSHLRRVALAGVDMNLVIGVFTVTMDDVFAVECVVRFEWLVRPKAVGINGQRLLWRSASRSRIVDSSAAFAGITYRCPVPRSAIMNTGGLSPLYEPRPRVDRPRERDRESRSRPFFPAETYSSSISTGPTRSREGASSASPERSMRR